MALDSDLAGSSTIVPTAKIVAGHGGESVIHLAFDGTRPPSAALDELRFAGWADVSPSPPPAEAIDWSVPDEARGLRYTLRPYVATTSATFRGTRQERATATERARSILRVAGLLDAAPNPAPDVRDAPSAPLAPAVSEGTVRTEVVVNEAHGPVTEQRLARYGTVLSVDPDTLVTEVVFRGNRSENYASVVRITAEVERDRYDDMVRELSLTGAIEITRR